MSLEISCHLSLLIQIRLAMTKLFVSCDRCECTKVTISSTFLYMVSKNWIWTTVNWTKRVDSGLRVYRIAACAKPHDVTRKGVIVKWCEFSSTAVSLYVRIEHQMFTYKPSRRHCLLISHCDPLLFGALMAENCSYFVRSTIIFV